MLIFFRGDIIKNLFKAVALLSVFSVTTRLLGFIFKIYLSRQIPSSTLGAYTVALSVAMVFVTALTSGLPLVISRSVAGNIIAEKSKKSHQLVTGGLIISLVLSALFCLIIILAKPLFLLIFTDEISYYILITLLPFILFSGIYSPFKGYLWGKEKYFQVSVVEFIEQIIKIIICFVFFTLLNANSFLVIGLSISIGCVLSTFIGIWYYKRAKGKFASPKNVIKPLITSSTPLTIVRFLGSLLIPAISIILPLRLITGGFSNEQALSLLGIAMGMTIPLLTIPSTLTGSLSMALIPQLSVLQKENNSFALNNQINSSVLFTLICTFLVVPLFMGIGLPICEFLFNNSTAGLLLEKYAWIVVPTGLMQICTSILNSLGKEFYTFITYAIGGIVLFICIIFLSPVLGIEALFLSMGINALLVTVLNYIKIKKTTNLNSKIVLKVIILCVVSIGEAMLCSFLYSLLLNMFPRFICIVLVCGIGVLCYFMLLFALNIVNYEYVGYLKNRLNKNK